MRVAPFFAGTIVFSVSCGHASTSDLFAPSTTSGAQGTAVAGTGGSATTSGSTTSGSTSATSGSTSATSGSTSATAGSTTGGGAGSDPSGAGGASDTVGAGGTGGDPTTTGAGGADPGSGGMRVDDAGSAGGAVDGGPPDSGSGGDSMRRIRCGSATCIALQQFCCLRDGRTPVCQPIAGGDCPTNGDRVYCDDRSDCVANQVCCAADLASTSSLADCRLPGACNGVKAQQLCDPQVASSCMGNRVCSADQESTIDGYAYCH